MSSLIETELKLHLPPEAARRVSAQPLLRGRARPVVSRLYSVYFDTPEFELWARGVTLRLRREGKRWVQTVKGGGTVRSGLHQRMEIESQVAGPEPDCTLIADAALAGIFAADGLGERLKPVFVTRFSRSSRLIEIEPDATVLLCVDRGEIVGGDVAEPVSELELELKSGPVARLFEFARKLIEVAPLRIENRSKAERGYALVRGESPAPVKARGAPLDPGMSTSAAFQAIAWAAIGHLQANEHGMLEGGDPEYLHQARVALRRLRSAFSVFSSVLPQSPVEPLTTGLRRLANALGPARDWDVFMTETLPPVLAAFPEHAGLAQLERTSERVRRRAQRRARRAVASVRYQRLMLDLGLMLAAEAWLRAAEEPAREALAAPAAEFAAGIIERRYERVRGRGRKLKRRTGAELHRLRIAVKKLRYAADFLSPLFDGKRARDMLFHLARLQNILGAMNDAATVEHLMGEVCDAESVPAVSEAQGILLGWTSARALALRRELRAAWKSFRACGKFW
jgi:triphosphatase